MENCGREDGLPYKKHIMPERSIATICTYAKKGHSIWNVLLISY
mgnify:CR=1 FL=1